MRFLLSTAGSHGDVHPFIAIGRALVARGNDAVVSTNPYFEGEITRAGVGFHASCERIDIREFMRENPWMHNPFVAAPRLFGRVVLPMMAEAQRRTERLIEEFRPDAALLHPLCVGGPGVCEQRGVPWASVALAPITWMSREEPICTIPVPFFGVHPPIRGWRVGRRIGLAMMNRLLDTPLNADRKARGLAPVRGHWDVLTRGGEASLGLWPRALRGRLADDPAGAVICGFPWYDQSEQDWAERGAIEAFLAAGAPPVLFTLGTATVHTPGRFFEVAAEVAGRVGRRAVLLVGKGTALPQRLPHGVAAFGYAPFSWIMPRCAASVHHGGIGSTGQGLRSGRPTVVTPWSHDQFDNAARVERVGCSVTVLARRATAARLEGALRRVLEEPGFAARAAAVAVEMSGDGAAAAAERLEAIGARR